MYLSTLGMGCSSQSDLATLKQRKETKVDWIPPSLNHVMWTEARVGINEHTPHLLMSPRYILWWRSFADETEEVAGINPCGLWTLQFERWFSPSQHPAESIASRLPIS